MKQSVFTRKIKNLFAETIGFTDNDCAATIQPAGQCIGKGYRICHPENSTGQL